MNDPKLGMLITGFILTILGLLLGIHVYFVFGIGMCYTVILILFWEYIELLDARRKHRNLLIEAIIGKSEVLGETVEDLKIRVKRIQEKEVKK